MATYSQSHRFELHLDGGTTPIEVPAHIQEIDGIKHFKGRHWHVSTIGRGIRVTQIDLYVNDIKWVESHLGAGSRWIENWGTIYLDWPLLLG